MTWLAQVGHVLVKDLRQLRWPLFAYAIVVAVATAHAAGWSPFARAWLAGTSFLVVLAGLVVIAAAMQADSPTRSDAFWATHPLRASAVLGAKVAFALLLIAIGVVGQVIALRPYEIGTADLLRVLLHPASVCAAWLLAAMLVAALVRDLRSFAVAVVVVPFAFFLMGSVLAGESSIQVPPPVLLIFQLDILGLILGVGMLSWLYRTRDAGRSARVAGLLVAVVALLTLGIRSPAPLPDVPSRTVAAIPLALALPGDQLRMDRSELRLHVRADTLPGDVSLALAGAVVELRLRDGTVLRVPSDGSPLAHLPWRRSTPREPRLVWAPPPFPGNEIDVTVVLTSAQRRAIAAGVAAIGLEGRVVVIEARTLATMPLMTGSETIVGGHRIRIDRWSAEFGGPELALHASGVNVDRRASGSDHWDPAVRPALVNPVLGEAHPMHQLRSSSGAGTAVLPGLPLESWRADFEAVEGRHQPDAPWLREAHLLLVKDEITGSYPIRLELDLP